MKQHKLEELVWERIDGEIGSEDLELLESHLEADADARARAEELASFAGLLSEVEQVEPPAELRQRIDAALAAKRRSAPSAPETAPWFDALRELWTPKPALRFASMAAALLVGALGYHLVAGEGARGLGSSGSDTSRMSGTVGLAPRGADGSLLLDLPGSAGTVAFHRLGPVLTTELSVSPAPRGRSGAITEGALTLGFDREFRLEATEHFSNTPNGLRATDEAITLEFTSPGRFALSASLDPAQEEFLVRLSSQGRTVFEKTLRLEEIPEGS